MQRVLAVVMLVGFAFTAFGAETILPPAEQDVIPGTDTLKYDLGDRYKKIGFGAGNVGKGWGVSFHTPCNACAYVKEIQVNLCPPPPEFGVYRAEAVLVELDSLTGVPNMSAVLSRDTFEVRVGCHWHYIEVDPKVQVGVNCRGFAAFVWPLNYPHYMYQWFDEEDNAPAATQWYWDGSTVSAYDSPSCGDIEIRAVIEAHDVGTSALVEPIYNMPVGASFDPKAWVRNMAGPDEFYETDVPVYFRIMTFPGGTIVYEDRQYTDLDPYQNVLLGFTTGSTSGWDPGTYMVSCSTELACDYNRWNDRAMCQIEVYSLDAGMNGIDCPVGNVLAGDVVTPRATVKNYGTVTTSFPVRFWITDESDAIVYDRTEIALNVDPGDKVGLTFDNWNASPAGEYEAHCRTQLEGDNNPANDNDDVAFTVVDVLHDVGATEVVSPTGTINRNRKYKLQAKVQNFGSAAETFTARCRLTRPDNHVFNYSKSVTLAVGQTKTVKFKKRKYRQVGEWTVESWTELAGDMNAFNDDCSGVFTSTGTPGWSPTEEELPGERYVNKGAALTSDGSETFYLLKGRKSPQIYVFGDELDEPDVVGVVPEDEKRIGHGTQLVYLDGKLYVLKANKSLELHVFDPATDEWLRLADMPAGNSDKAPKKGAALVVADGKLYVLKGNKTRELYCYDPVENTWQALAEMPMGDEGKAAKGGAALATNGTRLFALKGNRTLEFYTYDIGTDVWQRLADIPVKRVKDGACLTVMGDFVYATVGGGKMDFFAFDLLRNVWTQLDEVPRDPDGRKVKYGASMVNIDGTLIFLKGKKSTLLYAYEPPEADGGQARLPRDGQTAEPVVAGDFRATVAPNPAANDVRVSFANARAQEARVSVYNSGGQLVKSADVRSGAKLGVSELATGVYLLRINAGNESTSQRLVINR